MLLCGFLVGATSCGVASAAEPPDAAAIDAAFDQLKTYDYGQDDKPLRTIELHVVRFASDADKKSQVAQRLAAYLAEPKTSHAVRVFVCQQLLVVGTESQVPLLAKLLDDPQTCEIARFTLDAIPGEASLAALRNAAARLQGLPRIGAVNSLGLRRDAQAVPLLTELLADPDPQLAAASAESLGKIATSDAAAALTKAELPAAAQAALHNAQLQCAERLAAGGDAAAAATLYQQVWTSQRPAAWRLAGLVGLAKVAKDQASPLVLQTLASEDSLCQATALRLTRDLPGAQLTAALMQQLEKLGPAGQAGLLEVLGERGDRAALAAVVSRLEDKDEPIRIAAIRALAKLGDAAQAEPLAKLAATAGGAAQTAARRSLVQLAAADIEPKLLALAAAGEPAVRVEVIRALAARRSAAAAPVLLKAAADAEAPVRAAAFESLAVVAQADSFGKLVQLLTAAPTAADAEGAEQAVLATGGRIGNVAQRVGPVVAALPAAPALVKPALLRVLAGFGGADGLAAARPCLADQDSTIRDAAVRAVAKWPDVSAAGDLLQIAQASDVTTHRQLSLRGYLRLAGAVKDEAARLKMLEQVRPIATTAAAKRMLLSVLSDAGDAGALHVASSFVGDTEVSAEASAAALKIARSLVRTDVPAVREAMKKLLETNKDKAVTDEAAALDEEAMRGPSPGAGLVALERDAKRSAAQKAALAKRPPQGFRLACYLDCGPDTEDGAAGGPQLRVVSGGPYYWPDSDQVADARFGSVAYDSARVAFAATGLNPKRTYRIGFSWWDFDHATRAQSVQAATGNGERGVKLLDKTPLPSGTNKQGPETKTVALPAELYADGTLRITFRNEGAPNVVVSEIWLWESEGP